MATHISARQTQFSYFDQVLGMPVWKGSKILDFGGNVGGFLANSEDHVDHDDYWCLDVCHGAIAQGRRDFPRAHFVFYNRYSSYFNPNGVRSFPVPDLGLQFNVILAFSVFSHTHLTEMLDLVEQLRQMLLPDGVLAFTFIDPSYDRSQNDLTLPSGSGVIPGFDGLRAGKLSSEMTDRVENGRQPGWCVEVDDALYIEPGDDLCQQELTVTSYCSYFTTDYMMRLFPDASVHPPISPEWQHCCVLKNTGRPGYEKLRRSL